MGEAEEGEYGDEEHVDVVEEAERLGFDAAAAVHVEAQAVGHEEVEDGGDQGDVPGREGGDGLSESQ